MKYEKSYLDIFKEHYPNVDCDGLYGDYCPAGFFDGAIDETCGSCPVTCESCWDMPANEIWHEKHYVPEEWKAEIEDEERDSGVLEKEREGLAAAVDEVDEKHIDCPHWNKGNTLYNKGYGEVNFKCRKHEENFNNPRKLKTFINNHCYNSIWCNYCHDQEKPQDTSEEISAPAQTEATAPTAKYAEAVQLNAQIMTSAKAAQQNLYDMAMGFKKMRDDKLYKELGYDNFGDYCESETGMKRRSVYGYISVVENLPSDFVHSSAQIGVKKLSLLATLNEEHRTEIIENTDLESTTVKDLREQIEQLKQSEAKSKAEYEEIFNENNANSRKLSEYLDKNIVLERQLKELESRPRDVAVDTEELNRRLTEASAKLQKQAAEQVAEERRDFADKLNRMEEERDRLESRIAELESSENITEQKDKEIAELKEQIEHLSNKKIKVFAVKLTVEEFERLLDIAKKSGDPIIANAVRSAQIIRI